ncbi:MAG: HNH endonuclease [Gemmatimonadales bacterium]|nr:MAG: HNH endonuclease [Gemmatimonadales bacterium]
MVRFASHVVCTFLVREMVMVYSACAPVPASPRDPFEDADALEELEEEIVILAAHIHAATHRLLVLVAEFDRRRGWELGGHRSCAHWLSFRAGFDLGAAREKVRTARALTDLPAIGDAMSRGELSFSIVRALSRVATPENESDLLELARGCTSAQVERLVRGWKLGSREDEEVRERERYESRSLSIFPDDEGMYVVKGRLTPELGALLMRAVEAASDALYRRTDYKSVSAETFLDQESAQRRADALGLVAERALAAGFGAPVPVSGSRAERYQVLLHVDSDTLAAEGKQGRSELEDGTRVSAETSRRLTCDAAVVAVGHGPDDSVLRVGRRTRTISPALRRALEARDRGCRFPGCGLRFTDAHHVRHWADGGETSLSNLLLLCAHHHRLVHEEGWEVEWWGTDQPAFADPRGQIHFNGRRRPPHLPPDPVGSLIADNRCRGADPDLLTAGARWKHEAAIPGRVYFRAHQAVG